MRLSAPPTKVSPIRVVLARAVLVRVVRTGVKRTWRAAISRLGSPLLVKGAVVGVQRAVGRAVGAIGAVPPASSVRRLAALAAVLVVAVTASGTTVAAVVVHRIDFTKVRRIECGGEKRLVAVCIVSIGGWCGCVDGVDASIVRGAERAIATEIRIGRFG